MDVSMIPQVGASDADDGSNGHVTYKLQDRAATLPNSTMNTEVAIMIDNETGYLYLRAKLQLGEFNMFVEASDNPASASEKRTSLAVVVIR